MEANLLSRGGAGAFVSAVEGEVRVFMKHIIPHFQGDPAHPRVLLEHVTGIGLSAHRMNKRSDAEHEVFDRN
jgi:hypothetical protein